jgi:hypothetical protein
MAMPAMPGAGFVVIKAEFVPGGFEAVLDGPAMAFHRHQLLHGVIGRLHLGQSGQSATVTIGIPTHRIFSGPSSAPAVDRVLARNSPRLYCAPKEELIFHERTN